MTVIIWMLSIVACGTIAYLCSDNVKEGVRKGIFALSLATCIMLIFSPTSFGIEIENFPKFNDALPTILSLAFALLAVSFGDDAKKQQETIIKKLDDIQTKLETLENNLPSKQDTSTSDDSFLSRLLRSFCGE